MSSLLLLTNALQPSAEVLPALALLPHHVRVLPAEASALLDDPQAEALLVDARRDLVRARSLTRLLQTTGLDVPLLVVVTEGGLAGVASDWGMDDVLLDTAGPAEVEARLRLAIGKLSQGEDEGPSTVIRRGPLTVDEATYTARLSGNTLDLTYKEFELLKFLAQHPGRVFTRQQLLQDVWGYDYFGGTRTVDVHVRRLRAKLGPEHEALIGTVRNVGYRFVMPAGTEAAPPADAASLHDEPAEELATPVGSPDDSGSSWGSASADSRWGPAASVGSASSASSVGSVGSAGMYGTGSGRA